MSEVKKYRKKPVEIEAMQWVRTEEAYDDLDEWTRHVIEERNGIPFKVACYFMLILEGYDDLAVDVLGKAEVAGRRAEGYDAAVYDCLHGTWVNVHDGDWIIKGVQGEFYPCRADIFAATYEAVTSDE